MLLRLPASCSHVVPQTAAAEAAKKADEERAEEARKRAKNKPRTPASQLAKTLADAFEHPPLDQFKPYVGPLLQLMQSNSYVAVAALTLPMLWLALIIFLCARPRRKVRAGGAGTGSNGGGRR